MTTKRRNAVRNVFTTHCDYIIVIDDWGGPSKEFVQCFHCENSVIATVAGSVIDDGDITRESQKITLASCDECGAPLLLRRYQEGIDQWGRAERVWPGLSRRLNSAVPSVLREEYREATQCFEAKAYTAAVVMVRRTLEGVVAEKGFRERNLVQSLRKMEEAGGLDPRLLEWSQALRVLGNEGAHFTGKKVTREDASDAIAFCEALLDYLYVLSAKFEEFKLRRSRNRASVEPDENKNTKGNP